MLVNILNKNFEILLNLELFLSTIQFNEDLLFQLIFLSSQISAKKLQDPLFEIGFKTFYFLYTLLLFKEGKWKMLYSFDLLSLSHVY